MALLEVTDVHAHYGAIEALKGVSLTVEEGEVVTLIGSNGAGKSTTLRAITGLTPASGGSDRDRRRGHHPRSRARDRRPGHRPVARGPPLLPAHDGAREPRPRRPPAPRDATVAEDLERVFELFPRLKEREKQKAGTMSGGEQQMLAIGRALMASPRVLLLDEPSMGIAPILVQRIYETIAEINRGGMTILLVEQNANYALDVVQSRLRAGDGRVVLEGESGKLRDRPRGPASVPRGLIR